MELEDIAVWAAWTFDFEIGVRSGSSCIYP